MADDEVTLRPIEETDLSFLQQMISDPENAGSFMWQGFRDPREWRSRWQAGGLIGDSGGVVLVTAGGEQAGCISWDRHHWFGRDCWSLGIELARARRGRGIGTRAHRLLVDYLFAQTLVHRIEAYTETDNIAERRALEKSGFTLEGTLRDAGFRDGQWRDGVLYSRCRRSDSPDEPPTAPLA
ncbi:GNAT family N-acetyltransferase [Microlunatus speluncae]|uniref:GNAT family N-acetyltransferase n=1 Tax=Microlunatus speluncae TaxID=2594267 RepID=UPI0012661DC4|nr:GNAT family protein [Microlunatus speluncae]